MSKSKKQDEILIDFRNSNSVDEVTGSCVHVTNGNTNILLECGIAQGKSIKENYLINNRKFTFKPKELDYIFLMHNHGDHVFLTPRLYKEGCRATIFVPRDMKVFMRAGLMNSAMIIEGEAKFLTKRDDKGRDYEPLYLESDVDLMMNFVKEIDFDKEVELNDDIKFKFIHSGHVTASSSLLLDIKKGQTYKKIYYTSDLGNPIHEKYYIEDMDRVNSADIVISECTYSTKEQSNSKKDERDKDKQRIASAIEQYNKVLIPSFAFHRTETILNILYELYHDDKNFDTMIYLDSILLNEYVGIYKRMFSDFEKIMSWNRINPISKEDRTSLQFSNKKMIIIASSGFLTAGASVSWTESMIENPNNCFLFAGYTGQGTLANKIKEGKQKTITIGGKAYKNKAQITALKSFSGHIQYNELLEYLSSINCEKVILHHGNKDGKLLFKKDLEDAFSKQCKTTKVVVPTNSTVVKI